MQYVTSYYSHTNYVADITHSSMAYGTQLTPTDFFAVHYFAMNSGLMEVTNAYYPDGTPKRSVGVFYSDINMVWSKGMDESEYAHLREDDTPAVLKTAEAITDKRFTSTT